MIHTQDKYILSVANISLDKDKIMTHINLIEPSLNNSYSQKSKLNSQIGMQQVEELKHDFLSMISHELRTPLASMKISIQLLKLLIEGHLEK
ncbi:MAG: histidine kinase dimerization/phospho-acceptor domain-containing protein [Cyanobacteria bacterium P01_F01_bin.150]